MDEKLNQPKPPSSAAQRLLLELRPGEVVTSSRLRGMGISERLTHYLKRTGILSPLGALVSGVTHFT
jgi:hypothetical protein